MSQGDGRVREESPADQARCFICVQPCSKADRNTDGSYAHANCLRAHSTWPVEKGEKGGNLYGPLQRPGGRL